MALLKYPTTLVENSTYIDVINTNQSQGESLNLVGRALPLIIGLY
jgi:hypothetical protein